MHGVLPNRSASKAFQSPKRAASGLLPSQPSIPCAHSLRQIPLTGITTLPRPSLPKDPQGDSLPSHSESDSEDYSFIREAQRRAIADSSASSEDLDTPLKGIRANQRTVFTSHKGKKRFWRLSEVDGKEEKEKVIKARIGRGCLWVGVMLEKHGMKPTKSSHYSVGITEELRSRWVGRGLYNHVPGTTGLYHPAELSETVKTSLWPDICPLTFNTAKETYSFARYRAHHPKSTWLRRPQHLSNHFKLVNSSFKTGFLYLKFPSKPHLLDGQKYILGLFVLLTSGSPLVVYMAKSRGIVDTDLLSNRHKKERNYREIADLRAVLTEEIWTSMENQAKDLTVKLFLTYEKNMLTAQSRYKQIKGCFEIMQVRYVVSELGKMKVLDILPAKWNTKSRFERNILKDLLCDALKIKGLGADQSQPDDSEENWFASELTRYQLHQPANTWERLFPTASSGSVYTAALTVATEPTRKLCKLARRLG